MSSKAADVVVEKFIAAPPERIWDAWTNPRELEKWFFSRTLSMDAKPNGSYRILWESAKDESHNHERWGNYLEFDPPYKLVFEWSGIGPKLNPAGHALDPTDDFTTVVSITLTPVDGGTQVKLVHTGWGEGEAWVDSRNGHQEGWTFYLENMESVLLNSHDKRRDSFSQKIYS